MTANQPERLPPEAWRGGHVPAEEIVRRQGVKPVTAVEDMFQPETFESDEELDEFLADLYASRRAGSA